MVPLPAISRKTKDRLIFGTLITVLLVIVWALSFQLPRGSASTSYLTMSFCDVGQGDAILLAKGNTQVLVDGGPGTDVLSCLGKEMSPWDRTIELMVLTHPHADHLMGLITVLDRYQVERVLFYPVDYDSEVYQSFLKAVGDEGAVVLKGVAGAEIEFSGVHLRVLWPGDTETLGGAEAQRNINNASVVLLLSYGEFGALLLGDAEREAQIRFVSATPEVEVLKVAHQGSRDGIYESLLEKASPELAIISVGDKNSYGHPHQEALDLLARYRISVLRTDLSGTIRVVSNGQDFWYTTER